MRRCLCTAQIFGSTYSIRILIMSSCGGGGGQLLVNEWLWWCGSGFKKHSPHNSLDSSDSGKSLKLADDSDGFQLARASDGCKTFWLCKSWIK